jgi:hypothetical protein
MFQDGGALTQKHVFFIFITHFGACSHKSDNRAKTPELNANSNLFNVTP